MGARVLVPGGRKERVGRGFSRGELKLAGMTVSEAREAGITVDVRRRTVHPENVELLRRLVSGGRRQA
ncbi:MAG: ribosomal protein L13e [Aigarchaeota archaeon]|nr:ribosomal protein L13e [Aigarchaeota archaeon]